MPPESYADDSVDWDAVAAEVEEARTVAAQQVSDIVIWCLSPHNIHCAPHSGHGVHDE